MPAMIGLPASLYFEPCCLDHLLTCETFCDQLGHLCRYSQRNPPWCKTVYGGHSAALYVTRAKGFADTVHREAAWAPSLLPSCDETTPPPSPAGASASRGSDTGGWRDSPGQRMGCRYFACPASVLCMATMASYSLATSWYFLAMLSQCAAALALSSSPGTVPYDFAIPRC